MTRPFERYGKTIPVEGGIKAQSTRGTIGETWWSQRFIAILEDFGCDALVEVHDERELDRAVEGKARIIGVNNRNLHDFRVDLATAENLSKRLPADVIKVAESGIKTRQDIDRLLAAGYSAFLVGESLLRQNDRAAAVQALVQP